MERRQRRRFTPEFKARTVELVRSSGRPIAQICRELDLTETAVRPDPRGPVWRQSDATVTGRR